MNASPRPQSMVEMNFAAQEFVYPDQGPATDGGQERVVAREKPNSTPEPVESELIVEAMYSYGNYKIFASGWDMKLFTAGVEYDRHSWGYFLKARVDYVAEFLPFVLLDKPVNVDIWGYPAPYPSGKYNREYVPGIGFSPIGFRMLWRDKKAIKPYLEAKGGVLLFTQKVPSSESSYVNFSLQSATGVQVKMNERWGLRLGLFSDFHFSDAFIVPVNPGLDVMNANLGIVYHFTPKSQ
ncbi:MAG: acyloxyacyl hydrolase [Terracidiphilus sp.]